MRTLAWACVCAWIPLSSPASAEAPDDLAAARAELSTKYAAGLAELAAWCDAQSLADQAVTTRGWLVERQPLTLYVAILPATSDLLAPADASPKVREWYAKFAALRQAQAEALFELAHRAIAAHRATLAWELVLETARENPDHEAARRMLGYQKFDGAWRTPFEIDKVRSKQVWDDRFGWLKRDQLPRYVAGERFISGRWKSAAAANQLLAKSDVRNGNVVGGWKITTEHFLVSTNHSLEEGVRLAGRLERLYRAWQQLFVLYYMTEPQMARLFKGFPPPSRTPRKHEVVYFRNKDEYVAALVKTQPRIGITTGYYDLDARKAYFYVGDKQDDTNIYHEATHQLFAEIRAANSPIAVEANFWVVEGIACYMESLTERDGYCLLGGADAVRLQNARDRLRGDFYVPLAELTMLGRDRLQTDPRIVPLYSQSSGLTYFLLYAGGGRYRDALVDYLSAIYANRASATTLAELTGASYAQLDAEYRQFIETIPQPRGEPHE